MNADWLAQVKLRGFEGSEFVMLSGCESDVLVADRRALRAALHRISLSPCYHDLDTPNERLLDEDEPCPACIAREALERLVAP